MKPLVAIVGRPNVGKSTLFNRLIGQRLAIVEDVPGTTRDRIYSDAEWNGRIFTLIDTGGLELGGDAGDFTQEINAQVQLAMEEADVIVLMVDVREGVTGSDEEMAERLRRAQKPVVLAANKADNAAQRQEAVEFFALGLGEPIAVSSISGTGTGDLLDAITEALPPKVGAEEEEETPGVPRLAIVGRPNTGKSSLLNAIVGENRVIVSEIPGTTRDTIDTEIVHNGEPMMLIDTAGVRRRGKISPGIEKFSVLRANRAIDRSDVAILMIDGVEGVTAQDTHIAGYVNEAAKGLVIVINKWDLVREMRRVAREARDELRAVSLVPGAQPPPPPIRDEELFDTEQYARGVREALKFVPYAPLLFASAKTGYHVDKILDSALRIYETRLRRISTSELNDVVREAVQRHHPGFVLGRQLKIYYATQPEVSPPTFVFFVNDPTLLHFSYERYLENQLRQAFGFEGTAIRLQFRARPKEEREERPHTKPRRVGQRRPSTRRGSSHG
ncbi:MAG TPA: ribosome biogenesis GTPase Der [Ktedonobacterales bacterium]|nr:ribosome biogenesis GTPase Der [Ktedonobacterales bacterium]